MLKAISGFLSLMVESVSAKRVYRYQRMRPLKKLPQLPCDWCGRRVTEQKLIDVSKVSPFCDALCSGCFKKKHTKLYDRAWRISKGDDCLIKEAVARILKHDPDCS
jgi:hypothetical protein